MSPLAERITLSGLALALVAGIAFPTRAPAAERKLSGYAEVPVPAVMIYAGQPVLPSALTLRRIPRRYLALARVVVDAEQLQGKLARSTLVPGRPISVNQVREPNVINASKPVKTVYRAGTLVITGEAIPLSSASVGEPVRARNVNSGVIVSGVAQADGSLLVAGQ